MARRHQTPRDAAPRSRLRLALHCGPALTLVVATFLPRCVAAYNAQLAWSSVSGATGYKVYVRQSGHPYAQGTDVGLKAPDADGLVRFVVGNLDFNVGNYFAVTAYSAARGESVLSNELPLLVGASPTPVPARPTAPARPRRSPTPTSTPVPMPTTGPIIGGPVDAYLCDNARPSSGSPSFLPRSLSSLADAFANVGAVVFKPQALCVAVGQNGQPVIDPLTHQEAYKIKSMDSIAPQTYIRMIDQFGTHDVDLFKADTLLVPTGVGFGVPAPSPSTLADHYRCYKVTTSAGTARLPQGVQATVVEQSAARSYEVKKPSHLCAPVSENGQVVNQPAVDFMCYTVAPIRGEHTQGKIVGQIQTLNEFGTGRLDTAKEAELCVPAMQTP